MSAEGRGSAASRSARIAGLGLAAMLLTAFFMALGFPYDRLADRLTGILEREQNVRIDLAEVSPGWVRWGPGLEARDVRILQPDGTRVELARLAARPALSLSWLSGAPALATEVEAPLGRLSGTFTVGSEAGFAGTLREVDLEQLPLEAMGPRLGLSGLAEADVDVTIASDGPEGSVHFVARDGSVAHPDLPLALPFEELRADVDLGGEQFAQIREFELRSPLASGSAKGTIGRAPDLNNAPLRIEVDFTLGEVLRSTLRSSPRMKIDRNGRIQGVVMGTPSRPVLR